MTRDEQVTEATEYYYNDIGLRVAFEEGAQWADEHPKSPWISVEERLPAKYERSPRQSRGHKSGITFLFVS